MDRPQAGNLMATAGYNALEVAWAESTGVLPLTVATVQHARIKLCAADL